MLGDEDDRAYVAGLNEMDRELIMSERYEEREDAKERWNLLQKKKDKERRAKEDAAAGAGKITRGRRSGKETDAKKQKLEDLKARREKTKKAKEKKEAAYEEEAEEEEGDPYEDEVGDEDSADEWGGGGGKRKKKGKGGRRGRRDSLVGEDDEDDSNVSDSDSGEGGASGVAATMEEVQKIRLSRHRMEVWVHEPFFSEVVIGCFVRIGIGNGTDGNQVYKCAEIVEVEEGQIYSLGKTKTKKRIKLRHGLEEKYFKMASISNQDFTPQEFSRWKGDMDDNDLRVADGKSASRKAAKLEEFKTKKHTNLDVQQILAEKRKVGISKGNSGARRKQLELEIDAYERHRQNAEADEDEIRANDYDAVIQEKMAEKEELMRVAEIRRQRRFGAGSALNVAKINQRNIGSNFGVRKGKSKEKSAVEEAPALGPRRNSTQALNSTHNELDLDLDIDIDLPGTECVVFLEEKKKKKERKEQMRACGCAYTQA